MTRTLHDTLATPGDAIAAPTTEGTWRILTVTALGADGHPTLALHGVQVDPTGLSPDALVLPEHDYYTDALQALARAEGTLPDRHLSNIVRALRRRADTPTPTPFARCPFSTHDLDRDLTGYVIYSAPRGLADLDQAEALAMITDPHQYALVRPLVDAFTLAQAHDATRLVTYNCVYRDTCWHP